MRICRPAGVRHHRLQPARLHPHPHLHRCPHLRPRRGPRHHPERLQLLLLSGHLQRSRPGQLCCDIAAINSEMPVT